MLISTRTDSVLLPEGLAVAGRTEEQGEEQVRGDAVTVQVRYAVAGLVECR